jgi:hypothetical protein
VQFPLIPSCLVPLKPKYLPVHPILEPLWPTFFCKCEKPIFRPV